VGSKVASILSQIGATFASDRFGDHSPDFRLMLRREEQSAIADLMRRTDPVPHCIGFLSFMTDYDEHYSKWFRDFETGLGERSERLATAKQLLADLVQELDQRVRPRWG
jgi:hypothetical protein